MTAVTDYTDKSYIKFLNVTDKFQAIEQLASVFNGTEICSDTSGLVKALIEREEIMSTGIGFGIAIPHAKIDSVNEMAFAIGIIRDGINFESMDGQPVHMIILVAAGESQHKEYLRLLSNIMSIIKKEGIKDRIIHSETEEEVIAILAEG